VAQDYIRHTNRARKSHAGGPKLTCANGFKKEDWEQNAEKNTPATASRHRESAGRHGGIHRMTQSILREVMGRHLRLIGTETRPRRKTTNETTRDMGEELKKGESQRE